MTYRTVAVNPHWSAEHADLFFDGWRYATTSMEKLTTIPIVDFLFVHKNLEAAEDVLKQLEAKGHPVDHTAPKEPSADG